MLFRLGALGVLVSWWFSVFAVADEPSVPRFEAAELAKDIDIGYAVTAADVDGDGDLDAVVVDSHQVWWFESPSTRPPGPDGAPGDSLRAGWTRHALTEKDATKPHNICIAAADIDGDGRVDFALGTDWRPFDTTKGGDLVWLQRGEDVHRPWSVHPIHAEPTTHRIAFADLDGDGRPELVNVPLMGRDSAKEQNWKDRPVRILAYTIPGNPVKDPWPIQVLDETLHVAHNLAFADLYGAQDLLVCSYEGVTRFFRNASGVWAAHRLGEGDQAGAPNSLTKPNLSFGAGEVRAGRLQNGEPFVATVEPWHGHQLAVYTRPPENKPGAPWIRTVVDPKGGWGHAVLCADLDGRKGDEIIVGWRDATLETGKPGVAVYTQADPEGKTWTKRMVEEGVNAEAVAAADFDGDKKLDILVAGRQSHNAKILFQR